MTQYVQFSDDTQTKIIVVFGGHPREEDGFPNVVALEDDDPKYVAYANGVASGKMRGQRNMRLADCDWTELPSSPLTDAQKTAWAAYRQALRDLTSQTGFPNTVTWPTKPA